MTSTRLRGVAAAADRLGAGARARVEQERGRRPALCGSLGVSFVVLDWLYVVGRLMVAAPLLGAALEDHRTARSAPRAATAASRSLRPRHSCT